MRNKINNMDQLRSEILRLQLEKYKQEQVLKEDFKVLEVPILLITKTVRLFSSFIQGKMDAFGKGSKFISKLLDSFANKFSDRPNIQSLFNIIRCFF